MAKYLNYIPLAALAAILLYTGYKLANPAIFKTLYAEGANRFLPFSITVVMIVVTDLLQGMLIGVLVGIFFVIRENYRAAIKMEQNGSQYIIHLKKDVSFINKALLRRMLSQVKPNSTLLIDGSKAEFVDHDIIETIEDFMLSAKEKNIDMEIVFFTDRAHASENPLHHFISQTAK